jgi:hypothetical protein
MKFEINKIKITRGNAEQFPVFLVDDLGAPAPINGATSIKMKLKNDDNSFLEKPAYAGSVFGYQDQLFVYGFELTPTETAELKLGKDLTLYLIITFGSYDQVFKIEKALTIADA